MRKSLHVYQAQEAVSDAPKQCKGKVHTNHRTCNPSLPINQISVRFPQVDRALVQLPIPPQSTDGGGYSAIKLIVSELH